MKHIILISLILVCINVLPLQSKDKAEKKSNIWSEFQGDLSWKDANKRCKSLGMRLPRRKEFTSAIHDIAKKDKWHKYSGHYWTSDDSEGYFLGVYCIK